MCSILIRLRDKCSLYKNISGLSASTNLKFDRSESCIVELRIPLLLFSRDPVDECLNYSERERGKPLSRCISCWTTDLWSEG